jgi:hypothetical protein
MVGELVDAVVEGCLQLPAGGSCPLADMIGANRATREPGRAGKIVRTQSAMRTGDF